ncbi:MAG TPA: bifunctional aspartate kinase/homoserine dehydrogenase I [Melioribacteraceae bacterium]|mgnify:CR=1 FL=1|nr:bifunctional aspartate kinase/homoserine dehydrogenase I [Melioribacteraceae bacterium]
METVVYKFGGSSVGSPETIKKVIDIIKEDNENRSLILVFSAFQTITNILISTGENAALGKNEYKNGFSYIKNIHLTVIEKLTTGESLYLVRRKVNLLLDELEKLLYGIWLIKELSPRSKDHIMSFGERLSCTIITAALNSAGLKAEYVDSRKLIKTDNNFGNARVLFSKTDKIINDYLKSKQIIKVVTGFIGSTIEGETTTLGRGGSDYTASILGAALDVKEIQIWTDVDGVLTADPRKVKRALPIEKMSYEEALEMSHFGAKVIYPPTIRPALIKGIPIIIKNTFNPVFKGTVITNETITNDYAVTGISTIENVALINVKGTGLIDVATLAGRIFNLLAYNNISIILISQASSGHSICFSIYEENAQRAEKLITEELKHEINDGLINGIVTDKDVAVIAVVGENIRNLPGVPEKIYQALGRNGIKIEAAAQGSSRLNISLVISKSDIGKALNAIHDSFFLSHLKVINVFVLGTGELGKTLFAQLNNQLNYLFNNLNLEIRVVGVANTRKMLIKESGINVKAWEEELLYEGKLSNTDEFIQTIIKGNLPNSVFVDCTGCELVVNYYLGLLKKSVSIITQNKKACTVKNKIYNELKNAAKKYNAKLVFETNVGAGLPFVNTLQDLILSGDKIIEIEAVLSGTLSYVFNSINESKSFSDAVKEACELGYTEKNPMVDLDGSDIATKLLVLIREAGFNINFEEIQIEKLIDDLQENKGEEFFEYLKEYNSLFEEKRKIAASNNMVLRYIAEYKGNKASVRLKQVDKNHPFYELRNNENSISFTTVYYNETPVLLKGPGAGFKITSGGILADIIKIANFFY